MQKVDPFLEHAFLAATRANPEHVPVLPMLLRVSKPDWQLPDFARQAGITITQRLGTIVGCLGTWDSVYVLARDSAVLRIEACRHGSLECGQSVPFIKAHLVHTHNQWPDAGDQAIIAIIDDDIDVLHEAFQDNNRSTRILRVWDQRPGPASSSATSTVTPTMVAAYGTSFIPVSYGTEYTATDINTALGVIRGTIPTSMPPIPSRVSQGHGTHVASIAAGQTALPFAGGVAPAANIIIVIPHARNSRAYLDALVYIDSATEVEAQHRGVDDLPVVVNVSTGWKTGARDGRSLIDMIFDTFTDNGRRPGRIVVKSAGNDQLKKLHATVRVAPLSSPRLIWMVQQDHVGPDELELWFASCDHFTFTLISPQGETAVVSRQSPKAGSTFPKTGYLYSMDYEHYHPDNGDSHLALTIDAPQGKLKGGDPFGRWTLEIRGDKVRSPGIVHAWINPPKDVGELEFTQPEKTTTITTPGTVHSVICVGAVNYSVNSWLQSSLGDTRDGREKPDLAAPGDSIHAADSSTTNGVRSESGTSMAAPHVTGAIALLLSAWEKQRPKIPNWQRLNAQQIRAALTQTTQNYNTQWNNDQGYGVLDVEQLLAAFLA